MNGDVGDDEEAGGPPGQKVTDDHTKSIDDSEVKEAEIRECLTLPTGGAARRASRSSWTETGAGGSPGRPSQKDIARAPVRYDARSRRQ